MSTLYKIININSGINNFIFSFYFINVDEKINCIKKTNKFLNLNICYNNHNKVIDYLVTKSLENIKNNYSHNNINKYITYDLQNNIECCIKYNFCKINLTNFLTDNLFIYFELYHENNLLGEVLYITTIIDNDIKLQYIINNIKSIIKNINTDNIVYDSKLYKKISILCNNIINI